MPHKRVRFHLWEHDSTVPVDFCLVECAMLWRICLLSSCMCRLVGEVKRRASCSAMSGLVTSVRLGVMLGM